MRVCPSLAGKRFFVTTLSVIFLAPFAQPFAPFAVKKILTGRAGKISKEQAEPGAVAPVLPHQTL